MERNELHHKKILDSLPDKLKKLIYKCIAMKPENRINSFDLLECPWFLEMEKLSYYQLKDYVICEELSNKDIILQLVNVRFQNELVRLI